MIYTDMNISLMTERKNIHQRFVASFGYRCELKLVLSFFFSLIFAFEHFLLDNSCIFSIKYI